ncbi:hypothetical protein Tco_0826400 [Tanacetum coccineum]
MMSLVKCAALQERVGGWEWADMMALYCKNHAEEDSEFARCMAVKTYEFLNDALWKDDRRIKSLSVMYGYHDVSCGCQITVMMEISKDLRLAREINALCAHATVIVDERESFVDELDMLARRPVVDPTSIDRNP